MIVRKSGSNTVVKNHAVFTEHQAVAATTNFQSGLVVGIKTIQEFGSVRTAHINLSESGSIQHSDSLLNGQRFPANSVVDAFAALRKIPRPLPLPDVFEHSPGLLVPFMNSSLSDRIR